MRNWNRSRRLRENLAAGLFLVSCFYCFAIVILGVVSPFVIVAHPELLYFYIPALPALVYGAYVYPRLVRRWRNNEQGGNGDGN